MSGYVVTRRRMIVLHLHARLIMARRWVRQNTWALILAAIILWLFASLATWSVTAALIIGYYVPTLWMVERRWLGAGTVMVVGWVYCPAVAWLSHGWQL